MTRRGVGGDLPVTAHAGNEQVWLLPIQRRLTDRECPTYRVLVIYARPNMSGELGDLTDQQKEWFSRSFLVGIAAAAKFQLS